MLTVVEIQTIVHLYRSGDYSRRGIARKLGISRTTVDKVLAQYEATQETSDNEALDNLLTLQPAYNSRGRKPRKLSQSIAAEIDRYLELNRQRRRQGMRKQQLKKIDIWQILSGQGVQISYQTVCRYVTDKEKTSAQDDTKAYVRQAYAPGEECEFDWGEVKITIGGVLRKLYMAVFTTCHGNMRRAWLFSRQDTLAFMESHRNFFRQIQGVPHTMVYDNMRVAVKEFVGPNEKTPTEALNRLWAHYVFDFRFCNARAGWEKGHVERSVEYIRRKAFSLACHYASLADAQAHLDEVCRRMDTEAAFGNASEKQLRISADLGAMRPWPGDIGCFEAMEYTVDKWSTVCVRGNHYSVPDRLVSRKVIVKLYSDKLVMVLDREKLAVHERLNNQGNWSLKLEHYLTTLLRKPGALAGSVALQQVPHLISRLFERHFSNSPKEFLELLQYARDHGYCFRDITDAARRLQSRGLNDLSSDQIKAELHSPAISPADGSDMAAPDLIPGQCRQIEQLASEAISSTDIFLNTQTIFTNTAI